MRFTAGVLLGILAASARDAAVMTGDLPVHGPQLTPEDIAFVKMLRARELENGACVPEWTEYPWYPPSCSFIVPERLRQKPDGGR